LGIVRGLVFGLIWQAGVLAATGQHQRAARLLGGVSAISQAMGFSPPAHSRADQAATIDAVCQSLGRPAFDAAWAEGERLSLDELVGYALEA
jgi:hypothetical protein